jgi:hypothetical protein
MARANDDLDAVRTIAGVLAAFDASEQQRIVRWAAEKLGLPQPFAPGAPGPSPKRPRLAPRPRKRPGRQPSSGQSGLKAFVAAKRPKSDAELTAVVAYYLRHVAPRQERTPVLRTEDLVSACAAVGWKRPPVPGQTLRNARSAGMLVSAKPGAFSISPAGVKLVTQTLPRNAAAEDTRSHARERMRSRGKTVRKVRRAAGRRRKGPRRRVTRA